MQTHDLNRTAEDIAKDPPCGGRVGPPGPLNHSPTTDHTADVERQLTMLRALIDVIRENGSAEDMAAMAKAIRGVALVWSGSR